MSVLILGTPVFLALVGLALRSHRSYLVMSNRRLALGLVFELAFGTAVFAYLRSRGWRWRQISLQFTIRDCLRALGVWLLGILLVLSVSLLVFDVDPVFAIVGLSAHFYGHPSVFLAVIVTLVNPVFEEALWLGYAVNGPGGRRLPAAVVWSVVPRCLVHLYQGWLALFFIAPLGLWYLRYYLRTKRLWPIVIAHGLQDLLGLVLLAVRGAA